MDDGSLEEDGDDFLAMAVRHGLLKQKQVQRVRSYVQKHTVQPSDAAITLSMLQLYEVEALNLLCDPTNLAPGYELTGLLGCGAGGMVFRAKQSALGREVALKTINLHTKKTTTTGESRIQREAHAIARLHHPNIVAAYDSGFYQGRFCIAMELVEGETLSTFIQRRSKNAKQPIPEEVTWQIARQIASALSHACSQGIIHRDVKPANVLLCEPPTGIELPAGVPFVKVADFGLAFEANQSGANQLTATGTTLGTPAYIAPEQLENSHVNECADIYSLGATVYHMLTGTAPCADRSPMRAIMQKTIGDDSWRDEIPSSLTAESVKLFRDMTEQDIRHRIADYQTLLQRMESILDGTAVAEKNNLPVESVVADSANGSAAPRRAVAILALAILALVGIGKFLIDGAKPPVAEDSETLIPADWEISGFPQPLFNGLSVPLFRKWGNWALAVTADGSHVLSGAQGSKMIIPMLMKDQPSPSPHLRLRLGVHLESASVVEIGVEHSDQSQELALLRLHDRSIDFMSSEINGDFNVKQSIKMTESEGDDVIFQRIVILRSGSRMTVLANGKPLGNISCSSSATTSIHLRCQKAEASFADIDIVGMMPKVSMNAP